MVGSWSMVTDDLLAPLLDQIVAQR
jgi:hypothetical protein